MRLKEYTDIRERVYTTTLSNGLKIYVVPKYDFNKSYAFFATNYGGADRRFRLGGKWTDTPSGVAHFLEHKMFDMPYGNALTKLSENGASPNAFTSSDMTAYHFESTDKFQENLRILLEFVSTPYFTPESVSKEQGIIGQEIRMVEDNPDFAMYYGLLRSLYRTNPLRDPVAGTVESIAQITAETLYSCHKVFYNPSNMVLCVAGDQKAEAIAAMAEEILPKQSGEVPVRDYGKAEDLLPVEKETTRSMEVGMPMFLLGGKCVPAEYGQEMLVQDVTAQLAMETLLGRSSPLYASLYAEGLINANFAAEFETSAGVAYMVCGGESRDIPAVRDRIIAAAADAAKKGVDKALFGRIKKASVGRTIRALDSFDNVCYTMAKGYFHGYDPMETVGVMEAITPENVAQMIGESFNPDRLALSSVNPTGK